MGAGSEVMSSSSSSTLASLMGPNCSFKAAVHGDQHQRCKQVFSKHSVTHIGANKESVGQIVLFDSLGLWHLVKHHKTSVVTPGGTFLWPLLSYINGLNKFRTGLKMTYFK